MIHDELLLDGSSRLNLATFVTTWMEPEADRLMAEAFDKNMIDKDEYPQTAEIERRCVNMVAHLFNAPEDGDAVGASTIGSSEAVMLGRARDEVALAGPPRGRRPAHRQARTWSSAPTSRWCGRSSAATGTSSPATSRCAHGRYVDRPRRGHRRGSTRTRSASSPILGTTYTGEFEPIEEIHDAVVAYNEANGLDVPVHVDAASGGFVAPFLHPDLEWDFRLPHGEVDQRVRPQVRARPIPGIGFVVWRSQDDLPEDLVFHVNYLGGDMPTFTLNFSRPGNQIVGQYYNFLRLGRAGYTPGHGDAARPRRAPRRARSPRWTRSSSISDGTAIPVFAVHGEGRHARSPCSTSPSGCGSSGWQVPAYTMPDDATDVAVLRIVVREGFSIDLADALIDALKAATEYLTTNPPREAAPPGFSHT